MAWRDIQVGFARDGLRIGGLEVWKHDWRSVGIAPLMLPHPKYRNQTHRYNVYEIGDLQRPVRFAACELTPGVYGFYVPKNSKWPSSYQYVPDWRIASTPKHGNRRLLRRSLARDYRR